MLKPAHMQKVAVVGTKEERPAVVSTLYDMGVLHIEPLSKAASSVLKQEAEVGVNKEVTEELLRIRGLEAALPATNVTERRRFSSLAEVIQVARSINVDADVSKLKEHQERLASQLEELNGRIALVQDLQFVKEDLSILDLEAAVSFFGIVPASNYGILYENLPSADAAVAYSSGTSDPVKVIIMVPRANLDKFGSILQKADVRLTRVPALKGTAPQVLARLEEERKAKQADLADTDSKLLAISRQHYTTISQVGEQLAIEARQLEVLNNFGFTDSAFAVEGWVPERRLESLKESVARKSSATVFEIGADAHDEAPTLLENPKRLKFFESFIRFYSIPLSHELDPSLIFAIAFPIFFGLMLGDVGYAIVILLISIWIIRRVNHLERKTLMPKALRSFAGRILQPAQFKKLAKAMLIGSFAGIVMGFIVNSYFGFPVNQYLFDYLNANSHTSLPADGAFLNPISTLGLKLLLLYSGYIGLFMVSLGLVIGMLNAYWAEAKKHMIGKFGWLCTAWGIALTGLALLHHGSLGKLVNPISNPLIFLIIAGIGLVIYGEGGQAIIELPSIVSNIISFTRLLGILLASFVLAYLIDTQVVGVGGGTGLIYGGVAYAILGIVLFVMVHVFNVILGILEPGIQGARLLYVETFSKFLHGGGKPFAPFKGPRTYTISDAEAPERK
jgi:V/A-type H+-transporting ATPase subunit I